MCLSSIAVLTFSIGTGFISVPRAQAQSPVYANPAAQIEVRLQQMDKQIRDLTGKTEQQAYDIKKLKQEVDNLRSTQGQVGAPLYHEPAFGTQHVGGAAQNQSAAAKMKAEVQAKVDKAAASVKASKIKAVKQPSPVVESPKKQPLLNFIPPAPTGMKTAVPGGGRAGGATAIYEQAYAHLKNAQYNEARGQFQKFLEKNPDHVLSANAKYWLGETYYVQGQYKKSAKTFAEGFQQFPKSAKSPDILLKLGMSLAKLGKEKDACVALGQLAVKFPNEINPAKKRASQEMKKLGCK